MFRRPVERRPRAAGLHCRQRTGARSGARRAGRSTPPHAGERDDRTAAIRAHGTSRRAGRRGLACGSGVACWRVTWSSSVRARGHRHVPSSSHTGSLCASPSVTSSKGPLRQQLQQGGEHHGVEGAHVEQHDVGDVASVRAVAPSPAESIDSVPFADSSPSATRWPAGPSARGNARRGRGRPSLEAERHLRTRVAVPPQHGRGRPALLERLARAEVGEASQCQSDPS